MRKWLLIPIIILFIVSGVSGQTVITKGLIGQEDIKWGTGTFARGTSTGGTITLHEIIGQGMSFTKSGALATIDFTGVDPSAFPLTQIFIGFSATDITGLKEAHPEWWGFSSTASAAVNSAAIQSAIDASRVVILPLINANIAPDVITINNENQVIRGQGNSYATDNTAATGNTKLTCTTVGVGIYITKAKHKPVFENLDIVMPSGADSIAVKANTDNVTTTALTAQSAIFKNVSLIGTGQTGTGVFIGAKGYDWKFHDCTIRGFNIGIDAVDGNHSLVIMNTEIQRNNRGIIVNGGYTSDKDGTDTVFGTAGFRVIGGGVEVNAVFDIDVVWATAVYIDSYFESAYGASTPAGTSATRNILLGVHSTKPVRSVTIKGYFNGVYTGTAGSGSDYAIQMKNAHAVDITSVTFNNYAIGTVENLATVVEDSANTYGKNYPLGSTPTDGPYTGEPLTYTGGTTAPTVKQLMYGQTSAAIIRSVYAKNTTAWDGSGTGSLYYILNSGTPVVGEHFNSVSDGSGDDMFIVDTVPATAALHSNMIGFSEVWAYDYLSSYWTQTIITKEQLKKLPLYGATLNLYGNETELTLTDNAGAGVTWATEIPQNSILLAIVAIVSDTITTDGTNWNIGDGDGTGGTDIDRWGSSNQLAIGSKMNVRNFTVETGPIYIDNAVNISIMPDALSVFTAGKVKVSFFVMIPTPIN